MPYQCGISHSSSIVFFNYTLLRSLIVTVGELKVFWNEKGYSHSNLLGRPVEIMMHGFRRIIHYRILFVIYKVLIPYILLQQVI